MWSKNKSKYVRSLAMKKVRDADGVFLAEGGKAVGELARCFEPVMAVATEGWLATHTVPAGLAPDVTDEGEMARASLMKSPQGILAVFRKPEAEAQFVPPTDDLTLVLDGVQDPGNVGTIIRLADWLGIGHVVCSPDVADVFGPKVVQATMGALARVRAFYTDVPAWLDKVPAALPVYGTFMAGSNLYAKPLPQGAIVVMGSEGRGISPEVERRITHRLTIPTFPPGRQAVESLNVAVATAMVCAEFRRR